MPATSAQTLLSEGKCFACYGNPSSGAIIKLSLLVRILTSLNPMAATSPQALLDYAKCFNCYSNADLTGMMELALLDQISVALSGSTTTQEVYQGNGVPALVPEDPTKPALYTDRDTGVLYTWNTVTQTWT